MMTKQSLLMLQIKRNSSFSSMMNSPRSRLARMKRESSSQLSISIPTPTTEELVLAIFLGKLMRDWHILRVCSGRTLVSSLALRSLAKIKYERNLAARHIQHMAVTAYKRTLIREIMEDWIQRDAATRIQANICRCILTSRQKRSMKVVRSLQAAVKRRIPRRKYAHFLRDVIVVEQLQAKIRRMLLQQRVFSALECLSSAIRRRAAMNKLKVVQQYQEHCTFLQSTFRRLLVIYSHHVQNSGVIVNMSRLNKGFVRVKILQTSKTELYSKAQVVTSNLAKRGLTRVKPPQISQQSAFQHTCVMFFAFPVCSLKEETQAFDSDDQWESTEIGDEGYTANLFNKAANFPVIKVPSSSIGLPTKSSPTSSTTSSSSSSESTTDSPVSPPKQPKEIKLYRSPRHRQQQQLQQQLQQLEQLKKSYYMQLQHHVQKFQEPVVGSPLHFTDPAMPGWKLRLPKSVLEHEMPHEKHTQEEKQSWIRKMYGRC